MPTPTPGGYRPGTPPSHHPLWLRPSASPVPVTFPSIRPPTCLRRTGMHSDATPWSRYFAVPRRRTLAQDGGRARRHYLRIGPIVCLLLLAGAANAVEVTDNLVTDGGMEQWRATGPTDPWWNYLTVQWQAAEFARDDRGRVLTPAITDQFYDTKVVKPEAAEVHGGQHALRLHGQLYLRQSSQDAYRTRDGDIYLIRYYVRGEGQSRMHLHVYGDAAVQDLALTGKPMKDRWSPIEQRIQVVGRAPTSIFPRLWASTELSIDDVSVVRVIRPGERRLLPVPADVQKRIAFVAPTDGPVIVDGKLDEPSWGQSVAFSGFRVHGDQLLLAPVQPSFRILSDGQALYFGVTVPLVDAPLVLHELQGQPLLDAAGRPRPRTDVFSGRHSVELFLQAPGQSSYRQIVVSLDGYRYDSTGMDPSWNGAWVGVVGVAADCWSLELRVPAQDLAAARIAPAEGWRLNLCCNQPGGSSTWAAVGGNFHSPDAFGEMIAQDFATWQAAQPGQMRQWRAAILQAAGPAAARYTDRLAALAAAAEPTATHDAAPDWEAITRAYAQMDYLGSAYRCIAEEVRYRGFFQ